MIPRFSVRQTDRGFAALKRAAKTLAQGDSYVKVGVIGSSTKAARRGLDPVSNVDLAIIHEFGSRDGRVPERSFVRSTFHRKRGEYLLTLRRMVPLLYAQKLTVPRALALLGMRMAADMKATIRDGIAPPLAESTLRARTARFFKSFDSRDRARKRRQEGPLTEAEANWRGAVLGARARAKAEGSVPLIDTGQLVNSITYAVVLSGEKG